MNSSTKINVSPAFLLGALAILASVLFITLWLSPQMQEISNLRAQTAFNQLRYNNLTRHALHYDENKQLISQLLSDRPLVRYSDKLQIISSIYNIAAGSNFDIVSLSASQSVGIDAEGLEGIREMRLRLELTDTHVTVPYFLYQFDDLPVIITHTDMLFPYEYGSVIVVEFKFYLLSNIE